MADPPSGLEVINEHEESEGSETSGEDETAEKKEKKKKRKKVVEEVLPEEPDIEETISLDLLEKNTSSFKCLAQVLMSSSSLMRQKMRFFPPLDDPGLDAALSFVRKVLTILYLI